MSSHNYIKTLIIIPMILSLSHCSPEYLNKRPQGAQFSSDAQQDTPLPSEEPNEEVGEVVENLESNFALGLPSICEQTKLVADQFCFACDVSGTPVERCLKVQTSFDAAVNCRHKEQSILECDHGSDKPAVFDLAHPIERQLLSFMPLLVNAAKALANAQLASDRKEKSLVLEVLNFIEGKSRAIVTGEDNAKTASELATLVSEEYVKMYPDDSEKHLSDDQKTALQDGATKVLDFLQEQRRANSLKVQDALPMMISILTANPDGNWQDALTNLNLSDLDLGPFMDLVFGLGSDDEDEAEEEEDVSED